MSIDWSTIAIQFILVPNVLILDYIRTMVTRNWYYGTVYFLGCNLACALTAVFSVIYIEKAAVAFLR